MGVTTPPEEEPDTPEAAFEMWKIDPTPERLNKVVKKLEPAINYKLSSIGASGDPRMKHQARIFAASAIPKYDPMSGNKLSSFVQSHLQSMNRYRRENSGPVKVPERAQMDAWHLEKVRRNWIDEHGQEPDMTQLSDSSYLSKNRIRDVFKTTRPVVSEDQMAGQDNFSASDFSEEALEYTHMESDHIDRRIIELTTGFNGGLPINKSVAALKLGISPSQVTRRSEKIAKRLLEMEQNLKEVNT